MLQVSKCLIGLAVMMLQSCDVVDNRRDMLCGNWESVEGKPDVLIYKEGEAYKVTVFRRSGLRRKLKPETYLLQEENDNLFMNTGFRIDVSYNEAADDFLNELERFSNATGVKFTISVSGDPALVSAQQKAEEIYITAEN